MKIPGLTILFFAFLLTITASVYSQETPAQPTPIETPQPKAGDQRGEILRQLGLRREQLQQIRRINIERRPLLEAAQAKFREAANALDEAIYADDLTPETFQARLKDVQLAQAELSRIRYQNEVAVRRILSPEQLVLFRELRRKYNDARQQRERTNQPGDPARRVFRPIRDQKRPAANPNERVDSPQDN